MSEIGTIAVIALIVLVVFLFGFFIGKVSAKIDGYIIVSDGDEDRTRWLFDMKTDPSKLPKNKYVKFKMIDERALK